MNRLMIRRFLRAAPLAAGAAMLIPLSALAASTSVQPTSATLLAKGAGLDVTVTITCPAGDLVGGPYGGSGGISLNVQQAVSRTQQAVGYGYAGGMTCTGSPQSIVVPVTANPGAPFRTGPSLINAGLYATDSMGMNPVNAQSGPMTIKITK